jgi:DNA polymerase-3 subunit delta
MESAIIKFLYGPDEFSITQRIKEFKDTIKPNDLKDINFIELDGTNTTLQEIVNVGATVPFMSNFRVLLITGLSVKFSLKDRENWSFLKTALMEMPQTTKVIFRESDIPRKHAMIDFLSDVIDIEKFDVLKFKDVITWINKRCEFLNIKIHPAAISLLAESVGSQLRILDSELNKLHMYKLDSMINVDDINLLVAYVRQQNVFSVVDAVIDRKTKEALFQSNMLIQSGESFSFIIRMIERQLRLILLAKDLRETRMTVSQIGQRLSLFGYPLQKTLEFERRINSNRLLVMHDSLINWELRLRNSQLSDNASFELMLYEMSG